MKRKALLCMLLLALGLPWAANAQETVEIGTDGGTTGSSYLPGYTYYDNTLSEQIYTAEEVTIAGTITSIAFYNGGSTKSPTVTLYMVNTDKEAFSSTSDWLTVTNSDKVFEGSVTFTADEWTTITLDTPFDYDGSSNLGLVAHVHMSTYSSGLSCRVFNSTSNCSMYVYRDNTVYDPTNPGVNASSRLSVKNQIKLDIEPASTDCPNPKTLVASDVTAHGVTMTWTMEDETGDYQFNLEYKKTTESDNEWHRIGIGNTRTYPLSGLDAETEYQVRIQTACDPENTYWKNGSNFTTLVACPAPTGLAVTDGSVTANEATVTWEGTSESYVVSLGVYDFTATPTEINVEEGFENGMPTGWTHIGNGTGAPYSPSSTHTHSGYALRFSGATSNNVVVLPEFEVEANALTIDFWSKAEGSSSGSFDLGYVTDATDANTFVALETYSSADHGSAYVHIENYSMADVPAGARIAFRHRSGSSSWYWFIDDVTISGEVYPINWTDYTTTAQTYTFENLTPNTPYQAKVKGNCGSEGYSAEVGPVSFTTLPSCTVPTGLAIVEGSLTAHEVTIAWDAEEGDVFEYILTAEPSVTPENAVFNTTTPTHNEHWNSLAGDTDYFFFLRKKCGDTDFSEILTLTFHTLIACPAPTGLQVVEGSITARGASFSWNAEEGATFQYYTIENPWADFEPTEETIWTDITENTVGWTNAFSPNTLQRFYLRKDCGDVDGYSDYVYVEFRTLQEPVSVPFVDDFEDGQQWVFVNGNLTNAWAYGEATNNGGTHAMYISNDGGASNAYNNSSAAMVYATKLFTFEDGIYVFSYDWKANGESTWDYLRVALVPASVTLNAATSVPSGFSTTTLPDGWIALDDGSKLNLKSDWQSFATNETEIAAGTYMMVFAWRDDTSSGSNPPAAVDNVSITKITCSKPTGFALDTYGGSYATLHWNAGADAWQIEIANVTVGSNPDIVDIDRTDVIVNEGVVTYQVSLTPETEYSLKLRANCTSTSDGYSEWTDPLTLTTLAACSVEDVTISNIGHYTADVNWTGESERGFTVKYRTAATTSASALFSEDFEDETSFANWTFTSMNTANNIESGKAGCLEAAAHNGSYGFRFSSYNSGDDYNQYLVSPELNVTGILSFYAKQYGSGDDIYVGYSTTTNDLDAFTWDETALALSTSWQEFSHELPSNVKYIAFHYYGEYKYYAYVDDIAITEPIPAGQWQTVTTEENTANLNDLTAGTKYDLTVVPNCDETLESDIQQFTTVSENEKYFITEGDWGTAANWEPAGAPTIDQNVTLFANATITGEAEAKSIAGTGTGEGTYTLTIEDGGKLKHLNSGVRATVKKTIGGYGEGINAEGNPSGYYLIANPITSSFTPSADNGFLVGDYDLYNWNYTQDLEWKNYKVSTFTLSSGAYGYLYANETGTDLIYTGTISAYTSYKYRSCSTASNPDSYDFPSWYLLGNPYLYDAYLAGSSTNGNALPYIKMNVDGDGFENVAAGTPIAPMEGFFYQGVSGATSAYVVTYEPTIQDEGKLNMNLRKGNKQLDNAILVFGGNQQMGKMTFRANSSKIYMPVEGKDYAIVSTESNIGEMPVNFKAENNGSYTLSFNTEEVSFAYLHLIDNMTGTETDLLATPSYSFEARTTDYESRFKLVFATGNNANDDAFAFYSNGSFVINNEGNATLQVIDINGRILKSESINGCANVNVNAAAGVYVLRLVNGNDVKVQKVVVR